MFTVEKTTKYPQVIHEPTGASFAAPNNLRPAIANPVTIDFCCGMGGLSLAAQQLGMNVLAGIDLDRDSLKTFSANFPGAIAINETVGGEKAISKCRDALSNYPHQQSPLIVLSGPPCQGFSAAGTRDPRDKRNKVLLGVARAIASIMPTCALVENVQELLTEKHKNRVNEFKDKLNEAGFHTLAVQLNAKDYGVPQKRRRAFFLITRTPLDELAVLRRLTDLQLPEISCGSVLDNLPPAKTRESKYDDQASSIDNIANHLAMRHSISVQKKIAEIPVGRGPMSYRKLDPRKPANTLFSGHRAPPAHYKYPRSITTREAARLQGFPDDFRIYGSFGNQMNQVTNAVPPPLARTVLRALTEFVDIPLISRL